MSDIYFNCVKCRKDQMADSIVFNINRMIGTVEIIFSCSKCNAKVICSPTGQQREISRDELGIRRLPI